MRHGSTVENVRLGAASTQISSWSPANRDNCPTPSSPGPSALFLPATVAQELINYRPNRRITTTSENQSWVRSPQRDTSEGAWFLREELPRARGKPVAKAEPTGPTDGGASGVQALQSCAGTSLALASQIFHQQDFYPSGDTRPGRKVTACRGQRLQSCWQGRAALLAGKGRGAAAGSAPTPGRRSWDLFLGHASHAWRCRATTSDQLILQGKK